MRKKRRDIIDFSKSVTGDEFTGSIGATTRWDDRIEFDLDFGPVDRMAKIVFLRAEEQEETAMTGWALGFPRTPGDKPEIWDGLVAGLALLKAPPEDPVWLLVLNGEDYVLEYRMIINRDAGSFYLKCTKGRTPI